MVRNPSPLFSFKVDMRTKEVLDEIGKANMNKSEFIRNAILEHYERTIVGKVE